MREVDRAEVGLHVLTYAFSISFLLKREDILWIEGSWRSGYRKQDLLECLKSAVQICMMHDSMDMILTKL